MYASSVTFSVDIFLVHLLLIDLASAFIFIVFIKLLFALDCILLSLLCFVGSLIFGIF